MITIDEKIIDKIAKDLEERSLKVKELKSSDSFVQFNELGDFNFEDLNTPKITDYLSKLSNWEKEKEKKQIEFLQKNSRNKTPEDKILYIYLFKLKDDKDIECWKKCFKNTRAESETSKTKKYPQINDEFNTKLLYVGSSEKISSRISQHLGILANGNKNDLKNTYALQLSHWLDPKPTGQFNITIYNLSKYIDRETMQAIEDALWTEHRPCFGKRGSK